MSLTEVPELPASAPLRLPALALFYKHWVLVWNAFSLPTPPPAAIELLPPGLSVGTSFSGKAFVNTFPGW